MFERASVPSRQLGIGTFVTRSAAACTARRRPAFGLLRAVTTCSPLLCILENTPPLTRSPSTGTGMAMIALRPERHSMVTLVTEQALSLVHICQTSKPVVRPLPYVVDGQPRRLEKSRIPQSSVKSTVSHIVTDPLRSGSGFPATCEPLQCSMVRAIIAH